MSKSKIYYKLNKNNILSPEKSRKVLEREENLATIFVIHHQIITLLNKILIPSPPSSVD